MPWPEVPRPMTMHRVAIVAPTRRWRAVLAEVGDAGFVEPETGSDPRPPAATTGAGADDRWDMRRG